jgi:hypothetical protein
MEQLWCNELHYGSNPNKVRPLTWDISNDWRQSMILCFNCQFVIFNLHIVTIFSAISHTLHIIFCKRINWKYINCCISILSLNNTSIRYSSKDCNVQWALNMCNLIPSTFSIHALIVLSHSMSINIRKRRWAHLPSTDFHFPPGEPHPTVDPRTLQPVASHYTDWATRPGYGKFFLRSVDSFQVFEGLACHNLCFYEVTASKKDANFLKCVKKKNLMTKCYKKPHKYRYASPNDGDTF